MPRRCLIAVLGAFALIAAPARAADATCATLQATLDAAESGSTVTLVAGQTCSGHFVLPSRPIVFQGVAGSGFKGAPQQEGRSLEGVDVGATTVRNLTFAGADETRRGGLRIDGNSQPLLENLTFTGISNDGDGGAVFLRQIAVDNRGARAFGDPITVRASTFTGNAATGDGGGLFVETVGAVDLDGLTFTGNDAIRGGGARVQARSAIIARSTFSDNDADQVGGGLHVSTDAFADQFQGPLRAPSDDTIADLDLVANVFSANDAGNALFGAGGGMVADKRGDLIEEGSYAPGAPVAMSWRRNTFTGNRIGDGEIVRSGGGAHVVGASVVSERDVFTLNSIADADASESNDPEGGGLSIVAGGFRSSQFGATNLVVAGNAVAEHGEGGGIYTGIQCESGCNTTLDLRYATVAGNALGANGSGPGIGGDQPDVLTLSRSIVHGNTIEGGVPEPGRAPEADVPQVAGFGQVTATDSVLCSGGQPFPGGTPDRVNRCVDPLLVAPGAGNVRQTAASPTIDQLASEGEGDPATDFEGPVRPTVASSRSATPFDIGADEFLPPSADLSTDVTALQDRALVGDVISFVVDVVNAGPDPAQNAQVTLAPSSNLTIESVQGAACEGSVCGLGTLDAPARAASGSVTVRARATAAGTATLTATAASSTADPDTADLTEAAGVPVDSPARPPANPGQGLLPTVRSCVSRRSFRIRIRRLRGVRIVSATVRVNGRRVAVVRGRRLTAPVRLTGLPKGRFTVTISARTSTGKILRGTRRYRTCVPRRPGGVPPL